jgi:hypothetical protein
LFVPEQWPDGVFDLILLSEVVYYLNQCRYSGVEVPDALWSYAEIGIGKLYADTQADSLENEPAALAAFDEWTRHFARHVESKGMVEGADDAARGAKSTTQ